MKKVLLITPYYLTRKEVGGAFTYQFCERLAETSKIDVILYYYDGDIIDKPSSDNVRVIFSRKINGIDKYLSWFQKPWYFPLFTSRFSIKTVSFIKKAIKKEGYDFIVFDYSQTFSLAKSINHPHKILIAHDVIYQRFEREGSKLLNWIKWSEGKLSRGAEKLFAFSEKDCQLFQELYGVKCDLTPVFIKKDILNTSPNCCADYHVFFADWSRRDNNESLEWFLSNVAHLVQNESFKVIGGGMPVELIRKMYEFDNIEYLGFVDNPYPIIANAKSEICPLHTGAGIKVKCLEALACGTPVIGTEVALEGIDHVYSDYLFLANKPEEYARIIKGINYTIKEKNDIKQSFTSNYSQTSIINYISS